MHVLSMSKMIQIRNVPDALHRQLKSRAAEEGLSLSDYVMRELRRSVSYPNQAELVARIRARGELKVSMSPAEAIRLEREGR
jgi:plasmid stability protein